ncbi:hypothetical protein LY78DRAFT_731517 [Colletotrichum sublineola]|nr:hypothetical protein LY78DRAFT_731517 [Colletotrichum sublineola]
MNSLQPCNNFYSNGGRGGHSSNSASLETDKMLKNLNSTPGLEADAVPGGLEVNTRVDYSTAPQAYQSTLYNDYNQHNHAYTLKTNYTKIAHTNNNYNHCHHLLTSEKRRTVDSTICGLRKLTFWLIVLSSLLLYTLISMAGGIGVMLVSKNSEIAR